MWCFPFMIQRVYSQWRQRSRKLFWWLNHFFFSDNFLEVVTLVLTKSASCWGVQRVTDWAKFQVRISKGDAQTPLPICSHDYFQVRISKGDAQTPLPFCSHDYWHRCVDVQVRCAILWQSRVITSFVFLSFLFSPHPLSLLLIRPLFMSLLSPFIISALSLISGVSVFFAMTFLSHQARPRQGARFCCFSRSFSDPYFSWCCCCCWGRLGIVCEKNFLVRVWVRVGDGFLVTRVFWCATICLCIRIHTFALSIYFIIAFPSFDYGFHLGEF